MSKKNKKREQEERLVLVGFTVGITVVVLVAACFIGSYIFSPKEGECFKNEDSSIAKIKFINNDSGTIDYIYEASDYTSKRKQRGIVSFKSVYTDQINCSRFTERRTERKLDHLKNSLLDLESLVVSIEEKSKELKNDE